MISKYRMILNDEVSSNAIMKRATRHYTVVIKPLNNGWFTRSFLDRTAAVGHRTSGRSPPQNAIRAICCLDFSDCSWKFLSLKFSLFFWMPIENEKEQGVFQPCSYRSVCSIWLNKLKFVSL